MTLYDSMCKSFYCTNESSVSSKHSTGNDTAYPIFLDKGLTELISISRRSQMFTHLSGTWGNFASTLGLAYSDELDTLDKSERAHTHRLFDGMLSI